jgi:hypothetical protein
MAVYLGVVMRNNKVQYLPYSTAIYSKILVGIAYQSSVLDLKYVVSFFFS